MTRHVDIVTELHLLVDALEAQANELRRKPARRAHDDSRWEDHRTEAIAALWETLDRIEPGLGARFMAAQFKDGDQRYAEWLFKHPEVQPGRSAPNAPAPASTPLLCPDPSDVMSAFQR